MRSHLLSYGVLGASSCFALVEPAPYELVALLLLGVTLARSRVGPLQRPADRLTVQIVALFAVFCLVQAVPVVFSAQHTGTSAFYAAVTAFLVLVGVHLGSLYARGDPRFGAFVAGYCVGALFSALLAIASTSPAFASLAPDLLLVEGRPKALFKDPNVLGPYLAPAVLIFFVLAGDARGWRRFGHVACALACASGLVVTASRGAWVNLAVALAIFLVFSPARHRIVAASSIAVVALVALALPASLARQESLASAVDLYGSRLVLQDYDAERFSRARDAMELGIRNPGGTGPGEVTAHIGMDPHNTYLRIFSENGAASLVLFACILLFIGARGLKQWLRSGPPDAGFIAAFSLLAGVLVNASVVDTLHWRHLWVLVALCAFAFNATGAAWPARAVGRAR